MLVLVVRSEIVGEPLDRDRPVELGVLSQLDSSHAAVGEQPHAAIAACRGLRRAHLQPFCCWSGTPSCWSFWCSPPACPRPLCFPSPRLSFSDWAHVTDAGPVSVAGGGVQTIEEARCAEAVRAGAASADGIAPDAIAPATWRRSACARFAAPHESPRCSAAATASLWLASRSAVAGRIDCLGVPPQAASSRQAQATAATRNRPIRVETNTEHSGVPHC